MPQQSRQSHPSCQAPISVDLSGMEQYLKKLHANFNKLKRKVMLLEQEQEEHADEQQKIQEKLQELMDLCDSHDEKFQHEVNNNVEFRQSMSSEAHALKGQNVQFQSELRKHVDDHKKSVIKEIVDISKISLRVHQQNAVLEQQRSKSSSSSSSTGSGCWRDFLHCLGTAPAAAPAVAVVPTTAAPTTAAPMHTATPLSELSSTLLS